MRHILFFIESLSGGGAEKVLITFLKHLDYSNYQVTLMPLVDTGILRNDIDYSKLKYKPVISEAKKKWQLILNKILYKSIYSLLPSWLVNRWFIPQKGIDVYIAFTEGFSTKLLSYKRGKKIAWVHADLKTDPWTQNNHVYKSLSEEAKSYRRYNKVICVSNSVEQVMKELYGLTNTITLYNPIDKNEILHKANHPSGIKISSSFNIVSTGRLVPQKGYDRLIPIIGKLRKEGKDIHLYIIGEGKERKSLENIIKNEGLQGCVHLMGYMSNPYALMKIMDLFVCSSRAEGYSLAIGEAMTLGLPIISTECAGPIELLDHGKYGILVKNSTMGIYEGLLMLANNPRIINGLKKKSLERSESFDYNKSIRFFDNIIINN